MSPPPSLLSLPVARIAFRCLAVASPTPFTRLYHHMPPFVGIPITHKHFVELHISCRVPHLSRFLCFTFRILHQHLPLANAGSSLLLLADYPYCPANLLTQTSSQPPPQDTPLHRVCVCCPILFLSAPLCTMLSRGHPLFRILYRHTLLTFPAVRSDHEIVYVSSMCLLRSKL